MKQADKTGYKGWRTLMDNDEDQLLARSPSKDQFHFIRVSTVDSTTFVDLNEVDLSDVPPETVSRAIAACGFEGKVDLSHEAIAEICMDYGASAPLSSVTVTGKIEREIKRAMRLSIEIAEFPAVHEWFMNQPKNAIGSTAREFMRGDLDSAMERLTRPDAEKVVREKAGDPTDTKQVVGIAPGSCGMQRQIQHDRLGAECLPVQVWGFRYCLNCELRGKKGCGGRNIRKTGKNEKGIQIPV